MPKSIVASGWARSVQTRLAALLLASWAMSGAAATLTVTMETDLRNSEPGVNRDDTADRVLSHVLEPLVAYRENLTVAPQLAERIDVSADGLAYTFTLRPGVRFHDGTAVTAQVLKWNWQRFLDPATRWYCRAMFTGSDANAGGVKVEAVDATAERTLVFRLAEPSPLFLKLLASPQCMAGAYARSSLDAAGKWVKPVGSGPFKFGEWRRERFLMLDRFPEYAPPRQGADGLAGDRTARVDRVRFLIVPDGNAALAAFNAGDVDVLPYQPISIKPDIAKRPGVQTYPTQLLLWTVLLLQTNDPILKDVKVRQALAHAIDRTRLARTATESLGRANASAVPSASPYHSRAHDAFPAHDPKKARELLSAASYRGQPIKIQTNRQYKNMYDNAVLVQAMLKAVGVNATVEVFDWATQLSNYQAGRFQLSSFSYSARFDPALTYGLLIGNKSERATAQWESAQALNLLERSLATTQDQQRGRIFDELHGLMAREVPIIGLYNGVSISATAPGVSGFRSWPGATPILWGVNKK